MTPTKQPILVVEDDHDIRDELCDLLRRHEFEVLAAENGEHALSALRERPDTRAVVLDVSMPVMNGATFRGEQLADPSIAGVPLILITGRSDAALLARTMGAAACLPKPFTDDDVMRVLHEVLGSSSRN